MYHVGDDCFGSTGSTGAFDCGFSFGQIQSGRDCLVYASTTCGSARSYVCNKEGAEFPTKEEK